MWGHVDGDGGEGGFSVVVLLSVGGDGEIAGLGGGAGHTICMRLLGLGHLRHLDLREVHGAHTGVIRRGLNFIVLRGSGFVETLKQGGHGMLRTPCSSVSGMRAWGDVLNFDVTGSNVLVVAASGTGSAVVHRC